MTIFYEFSSGFCNLSFQNFPSVCLAMLQRLLELLTRQITSLSRHVVTPQIKGILKPRAQRKDSGGDLICTHSTIKFYCLPLRHPAPETSILSLSPVERHNCKWTCRFVFATISKTSWTVKVIPAESFLIQTINNQSVCN